ncbi:MAG: (d)CMP kinase [Clostridiales bacterium]|nr:(d)CMP kinase [Clostridiales bacterium]
MGFNIAIDGPAGAGKSTIAKKIAQRLSFIYVDTGAMYRAMGLYMWRNKIDVEDEQAVSKACQNITVTIEYQDGEQQVLLNGDNVNDYIRNELVGELASKVSAYSVVREKLLELQRDMAKKGDVLMDGRDIGTCVLPNADLKIYLTADTSVRAQRRHLELMKKGIDTDIKEIEADIIARDLRDMKRKIAPLKKADDAIEINTSKLDIKEVIEIVIDLVEEKRAK